ncbi:Membrane protein involved in the export of O-antigen and teichoic acid [Fibrobacter sp. UWH9]|uniref:lipopolysaccharide biosynthesis protein n=1 Tax=unclassified Fibrobacter TaxID=2634177 RepID=UPI00091E4B34|nr:MULTISPECIES: lipopolysaccharide biosynthesis protein [unclassified Fibrobacter]OWV02735.1 hypothetical protein B7993_14805 [Fibrobacter sp. UWH3]SHH64410.1 Membrane protein involved in the export of O-antigen and teichoic acid [Fibrobacter sp. UWH9]SHK73243.1 Membrane protein involved in the export of O-antigen and teichoic acid [Fibrobacter sp. UWH6]
MDQTVKNQTINSAKWNFLERIAVQGIQFILGVVMARMLVPSDYGAVGMLAVFFAVSQSFIDSGFSSALIRKKNQSDRDFSTVFYFNIVISLVAYGILFAIAPWVGSFFNLPILCSVLRVQAVVLVINAFMAVQVAMLQIKLDFRSLALRNVLATLVSGFCGVAFAYLGYGIWSLVYQQIIAAAFNLIFICCVCRWFPKTGFSWRSFRELGSFGFKLLVSGLLHTLYLNMTSFAIGKFYSPKDLGFYTRGSQFAQLPNKTINGVLHSIMYPIMAKIQDDEARLINVYRKYIRITSLSIFIFSGLLVALAKPIILLCLTDKWFNAIIFLQAFAFSSMFDHLSTINLTLLKVKGRSDLYLKLEVIKKLISVTILFLAIPNGVLAICLSAVVYNFIAVYINSYYTGKFFKLTCFQQFKDYLPYLLCCIFACTPAYLLTLLNIPYLIMISVGSMVALGLYWFLLRNNADMIEIIGLAKDKFRRKRYNNV